MKILVKRYGQNKKSTGGALTINGQFFCHTCEDEKREIKVAGETRIPAGKYEIKLRDTGGMNEDYSKRYSFHRGMLHLQDVPGFEWIYIHTGNNEAQTEGCILVGYTAQSRGGFSVARSREAYIDLYNLILIALENGEQIFIKVADL